MTDLPFDPIAIDVGEVLQRTVTSLYAHLITRPTGRAVRMAIETRLEGAGHRSLSLIDLSEVVVIDFSCADEVVAKLLRKYRGSVVQEVLFVFRGVHEPHRDQVEAVLERHGLATVAETEPDTYRLIGVHSRCEGEAWQVLEERGTINAEQIGKLFSSEEARAGLQSLAARGLAFQSLESGRIHALSRLVQHLI